MDDKQDFRTNGYLKIGDVLVLPLGTPVMCPECPRYLDENASPFATGTFDKLVQIGVPQERKPSLHTIRNSMTEHIRSIFTYYHINIDDIGLQKFIMRQLPEPPTRSFLVPSGLYEVTKIDTRAKGQKIHLKTYNARHGMPEYSLYFLQGGFHATHMDQVKVVVDPAGYVASGKR